MAVCARTSTSIKTLKNRQPQVVKLATGSSPRDRNARNRFSSATSRPDQPSEIEGACDRDQVVRPLHDQFAGDDPVTQRHALQEIVDPGTRLAIKPPFQLQARDGCGGRLRRRERVVEPEETNRLLGF